jgi:hypothetical protein
MALAAFRARNRKGSAALLFGLALFLPQTDAAAQDCDLAFERWELECRVVSKELAPAVARLYSSTNIIRLCFNFHNRGGHNDDAASIKHLTGNNVSSDSPLSWFNIVRFRGSLLGNYVSWVGTEFRRGDRSIRMEATFQTNDGRSSNLYTERFRQGRTVLGEVRTVCKFIER